MVIISCRFHIFRLRLQRSSQIIDDAGNDQENDLEELIMDQEFRGRYQFSKVVGGYTWRNLGFIRAWFYKGNEVSIVLNSGLL